MSKVESSSSFCQALKNRKGCELKEVTKAGAKTYRIHLQVKVFRRSYQSTAQTYLPKKVMRGELDSSGNYITGGLRYKHK
jgi:hypothetical protein